MSFNPRQSKIYTICRGNKTVSMVHRNNHYVFGFRKATEARRVLHNLHPEPKFDLLRESDIDLTKDLASSGIHDLSLNLDVAATLFVPKFRGSPMDPLNDGAYHMDQHVEDDFLMFPVTKNLGIVMAHHLLDETKDEFVYRVLVLDAF